MGFLPSPDEGYDFCFGKAQHLLIPIIIFARKVQSWRGGEIGDRESPGLPPSPSSASLSLISSYPAAD